MWFLPSFLPLGRWIGGWATWYQCCYSVLLPYHCISRSYDQWTPYTLFINYMWEWIFALYYDRWVSRWVVSHGNPEKMFPSNVLISLEAEKNPLSLIENPHKSPFRNFFYDHSKVELFSFLCSNFYKKILSLTRQRKDATAAAQLTLILNARVSYHKCHTHK